MTPLFAVQKCKENTINITGLSMDIDGYIPEYENSDSYEKYKYSESCTLNIITYESNGVESLFATKVSNHTDLDDTVKVELQNDGIYNIYHVILPTKEWLQDKINNNKDFLDYYTNIYVIDGEQVYKYKDEEYKTCNVEEIIEINPYKTTLLKSSKSIFSTYNLYQCYLNLCLNLFDPSLCKGCNKDQNTELIFKRDFVWMALNIIEYYVELDLLYEAEKVLLDINSCNGFCPTINIKKKQNCGCKKNQRTSY